MKFSTGMAMPALISSAAPAAELNPMHLLTPLQSGSHQVEDLDVEYYHRQQRHQQQRRVEQSLP